MRLVIKLTVQLGGRASAATKPETKVGDATSTPVGFSPSPGDQAWESGVDR